MEHALSTFTPKAVARYNAFLLLLALPDLPCLPKRAKRYTCAGDLDQKDEIKRDLAYAYVRYRMLDAGEDASIVSVRRFRLRLMRRTA